MKREFTETLKGKLRDRAQGITPRTDPENDRFLADNTVPEYDPYEDDKDSEHDADPMDTVPISEEDDQLEVDRYVFAEVQLTRRIVHGMELFEAANVAMMATLLAHGIVYLCLTRASIV